MYAAPRSILRGFSLVGMLVTLACIAVLITILATALNRATTGEGSANENTLRSAQDKLALYALYQSMAVGARDFDGWFLVPSVVSGTHAPAEDTTANLYSAMVMARYITPTQLISANEYSTYVWVDENYDTGAYDPHAGVYWDPTFKADLDGESNVSFAHVPLFGERFEANWKPFADSAFPLLGNRGPKDGILDPSSFTLGRNGTWGGHVVFGDGHIDFRSSFTLARTAADGAADNIFSMQDGADGADAVISFTKSVSDAGPVLQHD